MNFSHPKTVNLNSAIPVNEKMTRIVKHNCPQLAPDCIVSSYRNNKKNSPFGAYGAQLNSWGTVAGRNCVGPIYTQTPTVDGEKIVINGCITHYNGISRGGNAPGICDYAGATARGYFSDLAKTPSRMGEIVQDGPITNSKPGPIVNGEIQCQYFRSQFTATGNNSTWWMPMGMSFTSVCL